MAERQQGSVLEVLAPDPRGVNGDVRHRGGVVIYGVSAELYAIQALATEKVGPNTRNNVWLGCVLLMLAVAVGPVSWYVGAFFGTLNDDQQAGLARRRARLAAERKNQPQRDEPLEPEPEDA